MAEHHCLLGIDQVCVFLGHFQVIFHTTDFA